MFIRFQGISYQAMLKEIIGNKISTNKSMKKPFGVLLNPFSFIDHHSFFGFP